MPLPLEILPILPPERLTRIKLENDQLSLVCWTHQGSIIRAESIERGLGLDEVIHLLFLDTECRVGIENENGMVEPNIHINLQRVSLELAKRCDEKVQLGWIPYQAVRPKFMLCEETRGLRETGSQTMFEIPPSGALVGRDAECDIIFQQDGISARHALFQWREPEGVETVAPKSENGPEAELWVCDLESTNGITHNGQRVQEVKLACGDQLQLGDAVLHVRVLQNVRAGKVIDFRKETSVLSAGDLQKAHSPSRDWKLRETINLKRAVS